MNPRGRAGGPAAGPGHATRGTVPGGWRARHPTASMRPMPSRARFPVGRQRAAAPAPPARPARRVALLLGALLAAVVVPPAAVSHPAADLEVGDPLEAEIRALELVPGAWGDLPGPAWGTRPWRLRDLVPPAAVPSAGPIAAPSWRRLERALHREREGPATAGPPGASRHLVRLDEAGEGTRLDLSARLEGRLVGDPDTVRFATLSGLHLRGSLGFRHWVLQSHWLVGQVDSARRFGDPIVTGEDLVATAEQALVAYAEPGARWGARFGRGRWHWGPGHEGSLLLSRTSAPLTALEAHAALLRGRLVLTALSATLHAAAGEQLAAHRVEWRAAEGLRFAASEAAVYASSGWRPLYVLGLLPYTVVQRLEVEDEPGREPALRNNVLVSFDASWRIAAGSRVYAELLLDDVHARTRDNPDKLGFQLGWDGAGTAFGSRVRWNGEFTRLTPYTYTSFFGREASARGRPLGFPTGPDARRLRVWSAWDPGRDFEVSAAAARTDKGENDLGEPFVPGAPWASSVWRAVGVVERAREVELRLRWWPAGGVDVSVSGGYEWRENAGHVAGRSRDRGRAALEFRIGR